MVNKIFKYIHLLCVREASGHPHSFVVAPEGGVITFSKKWTASIFIRQPKRILRSLFVVDLKSNQREGVG